MTNNSINKILHNKDKLQDQNRTHLVKKIVKG